LVSSYPLAQWVGTFCWKSSSGYSASQINGGSIIVKYDSWGPESKEAKLLG